MRILVTGTAGFIGYHVAKRLLDDGHEVTGVDCLNDYYDVGLKESRLERLMPAARYTHHRVRLEDGAALGMAFHECEPERVIHLAAQAGVRHSLNSPGDYVESNLAGFLNMLELCRHSRTPHLVYASTSSVYGLNADLPSSETDSADHPVSFYAATKRANEVMAHSYSHLYRLPTTGLRFYTVYGPWGRPDMALFKFTRAMLADEPITLYNGGMHKRDWTYVDDIVEGIVRVMDHVPEGDPDFDAASPVPDRSSAPYRIFNIGNGDPLPLMDLISVLERVLGREARKEMLPMQAGDVQDTHADVSALERAVGYRPSTDLEQGIRAFVDWYREHHR